MGAQPYQVGLGELAVTAPTAGSAFLHDLNSSGHEPIVGPVRPRTPEKAPGICELSLVGFSDSRALPLGSF
jgi:hypothetical protein